MSAFGEESSNTNEIASIDYWRLSSEYSVIDAALLIVGKNPSSYRMDILTNKVDRMPKGYEAAETALKNAIASKTLNAKVVYEIEDNDYYQVENPETSGELLTYKSISLDKTLISEKDIRNWLKSRGITSGFFFPQGGNLPDYMDRNSPYYSPKLAAAVEAWQAISLDDKARSGKSTKQALQKWLRINAVKYDLIKEDGSQNETGIEDIAKIANWDGKGGAPKTPSSETIPVKTANLTLPNPLDDMDIPF